MSLIKYIDYVVKSNKKFESLHSKIKSSKEFCFTNSYRCTFSKLKLCSKEINNAVEQLHNVIATFNQDLLETKLISLYKIPDY
ncbi:MAG: hypothetical protein N3A01_02870 [Bacteroidales bacterium]|nr:hypothetical protein [Bacteroidales bacterium]